MKCFDCICGIRDENGKMWCAKYKRIPTEEMIENCKCFLERDKVIPPAEKEEVFQ